MLRVTPAPEPDDFDAAVRSPGKAFLRKNLNPTARDWQGHDYWRLVRDDMLREYGNVCSYSGSWTKPNSGSATGIEDSSIDHFMPKSKFPSEAYEWSNFRLARRRLNLRKADHTDILDPFSLPNGWFTLDFGSFFIRPSHELSALDRSRVIKTIDRLELNADDDYVEERLYVVREYCLGRLTLYSLDERWPFIAREMRRQNFDAVFLELLRPVFEEHDTPS